MTRQSNRFVSFLLAILMMLNIVMPASAAIEINTPGAQNPQDFVVSASFVNSNGNPIDAQLGLSYYLFVGINADVYRSQENSTERINVFFATPVSSVDGSYTLKLESTDFRDDSGNPIYSVILSSATVTGLGFVQFRGSEIKPNNIKTDGTAGGFGTYDGKAFGDSIAYGYYTLQPSDGDWSQTRELKFVADASKLGNEWAMKDKLGDANEYGIIANTWKQTAHAETNFAVYNYSGNGQVVEVMGNGTEAQGVPVYVQNISDKLTFGGANHSPVDLYTDLENVLQGKIADSKGNVNIKPTSSSDVHSEVETLIGIGTSLSNEFKNTSIHPTTITPHLDAEENTVLDLLAFDDNCTIYIDATYLHNWLATNKDQKVIKKRPNQNVVFNIPGDSVTINKFNVEIYNSSNEKIESLNSATAGLNADPDTNENIYWKIMKRFVFNAHGASYVDLTDCSGLFLAPNADTDTSDGHGVHYKNTAGWLNTAGGATGTGEWHYYVYERTYHANDHLNGVKVLKDNSGNTISIDREFTYKLVKDDGNSYGNYTDNLNRVVKTNKGSLDFGKISFNSNNDGHVVVYVFEEKAPGPAITYDETVYKVTFDARTRTLNGGTAYAKTEFCCIRTIEKGRWNGQGSERTFVKDSDGDSILVYFENTKNEDEKGKLKIKKLVTVNGSSTNKTFADGEYSFTIKRGNNEVEGKSPVKIKIEQRQVLGFGMAPHGKIKI